MPAIDDYTGYSGGLESPLAHAREITPDDGTDIERVSRALHIGIGGDLRVTMAGGPTVTFRGLSAGWHPLRVSRIHASGTTASDIVAGW